MKTSIQSVKGTREFYPEDMAIHQWLYGKIREVSELFGYQEYDGPFLEKIELYAAKSGEELVKEQSFVFPDRNNELITLRPELTPSLARMIAQKQGELVFPARWWSFGPFWRYERPQKGRTREFFQWNIDQIGANSPEADAEMIGICAAFLKSVGLSPAEVIILVNDRQLMDQEIAAMGIAEEKRKGVSKLIDRKDKLRPIEWDQAVLDEGFSADQLSYLKDLLNNKDLWQKSSSMTRMFEVLKLMGAADYVRYDPNIVRGLDYYTGVVFEAWDAGAEGRAVLGGGHYDNLVGDVGGNPLPGVGFAMGDVMISLVLEKYGKLPEVNLYDSAILVTVFDDSLRDVSMELASEIRSSSVRCICYSDPGKLQKQLKYADRLGMAAALVIGPDEAQEGNVTIKDLKNHTQKTVRRTQVQAELQQILARS